MTTDRQRKTRERNWDIGRLRGAHQTMRMTIWKYPETRFFAEQACQHIDLCLRLLGVETETDRAARYINQRTD